MWNPYCGLWIVKVLERNGIGGLHSTEYSLHFIVLRFRVPRVPIKTPSPLLHSFCRLADPESLATLGTNLHYHCGHPNRPASPSLFPRGSGMTPRMAGGSGGRGLYIPCCPCQHHRLQQRREFIMHNKAPLWNETSQVHHNSLLIAR